MRRHSGCALCFVFLTCKTAYEMRISDWSSDVCPSDLCGLELHLDGWAEATLRALFSEELGAVVQVAAANREAFESQIGRASWRERVCRHVSISGVVVSLNKASITVRLRCISNIAPQHI